MLAPWIISHFPAHRCYVEPFFGGGSVLLRKPRSYAEIVGDKDDEIVNVFRVLQCVEMASKLERKLRFTPFARAEYEAAHTDIASDPIERARRTIIRSYMGFGADSTCNPRKKSGFRADSNRAGTTPAHDWRNYPDAVEAFTSRLQGVVIEDRCAFAMLERWGDRVDYLWYVDPPYVHGTRTRPDWHGYAHELSDEQHRELAEALCKVRGCVVLSGYHSPLYDDLYKGWRRVERKAFADGARSRTEVLWMNFPEGDRELFPASEGAAGS